MAHFSRALKEAKCNIQLISLLTTFYFLSRTRGATSSGMTSRGDSVVTAPSVCSPSHCLLAGPLRDHGNACEQTMLHANDSTSPKVVS